MPPIAWYAVRVRVGPSRRSASSVSAYWSSGSAPGSSCTSATISASRPVFELQTDAARGHGDRPLELVGRERQHDLDAVAEKLAEVAIEKRAIVEIGTDR